MAYINKKRTWHECTDKNILSVYNEVMAETKRLYPEYFDCDVKFYIDSSTKHLGSCKYAPKKETLINKWGYAAQYGDIRFNEVVILLSKYVTDTESVRKVLVHEAGHLVTPREHHSYNWKIRADKIGAKWGITCQRLATEEEAEQFNKNIPTKQTKGYTVVCSKCGRIVHRQRMCGIIEHPELWRCGVCGGTFKKGN